MTRTRNAGATARLTLYPEDVFVLLLSAADRHGLVVGRGGRVDHGDDGHGEVDPQHVSERHSYGAQEHKRVPGAEALNKMLNYNLENISHNYRVTIQVVS